MKFQFLKDIEYLKDQVERLWESKADKESNRVCETCGCLINRGDAIRGSGEIRTKDFIECGHMITGPEYIYHPYYCKVHYSKRGSKK